MAKLNPMSKLNPMAKPVTTWEELKKYDGNPPPKALPRLPGVNVAYGKYNKKMALSHGTTANDFIMKKLTNEYPNEYNIITKNKFPYYLAPGIMHLVLWINPLYEKDEKNTEQNLRREITNKLQSIPSADVVLYENLPKHRSVSSVRHYQLFVFCNNINTGNNKKTTEDRKKEIEDKLIIRPAL